MIPDSVTEWALIPQDRLAELQRREAAALHVRDRLKGILEFDPPYQGERRILASALMEWGRRLEGNE